MRPFIELVFLNEIRMQAEAAERAMLSFNQELTAGSASAAHDFAGDFLNRAAMVSKILRPGGKPDDAPRIRGRFLRKSLGIDDNHPALNRDLRDILEHIDESIDSWVTPEFNANGMFIDKTIGPNAVRVRGVEAPPSLRDFDGVSKLYSVLGQKFDLQAIYDAVMDVLQLVAERERQLRIELRMHSRRDGDHADSGQRPGPT